MKKCYVQLTSGIGNVIQTIPFIKECHKHFDEVIGVWTQGNMIPAYFMEIAPMIHHLFTNSLILNTNFPKDGKYFSSIVEDPARSLFGEWDEPEHAKWFTAHDIPKPVVYDTSLNFLSSNSEVHQVVIWAGCKPNWTSKRWPHWDKLCNKFEDIAIVGYPDEGDNIPDHVVDYRGKINLQDTASIISRCQVYIGNEGGTSHLAAALGGRTYIIYGATDPLKNHPPQREGLHRIALNLPCQPCQWTHNKHFNPIKGCDELSCLNYLTADMVLAYIDKSLEPYAH